ncbi:hypothetical protein PV325_013679, partial [Microctonus aethiopoides]
MPRRLPGMARKLSGKSYSQQNTKIIMREWDVIIMMETWVEEKDWEKVKERLPEGYLWRAQPAKREHKKGRARGGMVTEVREERRKRNENGG